MKYIGIDNSILHPAITIFDNETKKYNFITIFNEKHPSRNVINNLLEVNKNDDIDILVMIQDDLASEKKIPYYLKEQLKMLNQFSLVNHIAYTLSKYINSKDEIRIVMEGFSYGSSGNVLFDLGNVTGMLKYVLMRDYITNSKINGISVFHIESPKTLKKFYLNGNASKIELFEKFILETDKYLQESSFFNFLKENEFSKMIRTPKNIKSPWNDIIDSYIANRYAFDFFNPQGGK